MDTNIFNLNLYDGIVFLYFTVFDKNYFFHQNIWCIV